MCRAAALLGEQSERMARLVGEHEEGFALVWRTVLQQSGAQP